MSLSNYEVMRNQMRGEFVKYDQEQMIQKFDLTYDEAYLYLTFVKKSYRIDRREGVITWSEDQFLTVVEADYNESMTIYDVLCYSKADCHLSGKFCPIHAAKGVTRTMHAGSGMFQKTAERFQGRIEALRYACEALGEPADLIGDVAAKLEVFSFLPVIFQYWEGDDEFPPNLKFMFDENILDYMHFETVHFMMGHILRRIEEIADTYIEAKAEK